MADDITGKYPCANQHGLRLSKDPKIVGYYNALLDIMVPKEGVVSNKKSSKYRHLQDKNSIHGFLTALNWVPKKLPTGPLEVATQGPQ
jgi:hypothetical protein